MRWYYIQHSAQAGPVEEPELRDKLAARELPPDTPVWQPLLPGWLPATQAGLLAYETAPPHCTRCGKLFPAEELLAYEAEQLCAGCKVAFFQGLREGTAVTSANGAPRWAGFGLRAAAKLIDLLLFNLLSSPLFAVVMIWSAARHTPDGLPDAPFMMILWPIFGLLITIAQAAYQIVFTVRWGATPGKRLLGLRVVRADGGRVGVWRATGRYLAEMLSSGLCWLGYLLAIFDEEKRTLHDQLAGTRVVIAAKG